MREGAGLRAQALPPEFEGDSDGYIDVICHNVLPKLASENLATALNAFFDTDQLRAFFCKDGPQFRAIRYADDDFGRHLAVDDYFTKMTSERNEADSRLAGSRSLK
jgi:hypothetical protein